MNKERPRTFWIEFHLKFFVGMRIYTKGKL